MGVSLTINRATNDPLHNRFVREIYVYIYI